MAQAGAQFISAGVSRTFTATTPADLSVVAANPQSAAYTLALTDAGAVVESISASAVTITVPLNASVAFPVGTVIEVLQYGAGQVTLAGATSGVTLRTASSLTTRAQYSSLSLRYRGSDEWIVGGDLT